MVDILDQMDEREELANAANIAQARAKAAEIKPGVPGDCELCGEWSGRLVRGACAPRRDKWKLP